MTITTVLAHSCSFREVVDYVFVYLLFNFAHDNSNFFLQLRNCGLMVSVEERFYKTPQKSYGVTWHNLGDRFWLSLCEITRSRNLTWPNAMWQVAPSCSSSKSISTNASNKNTVIKLSLYCRHRFQRNMAQPLHQSKNRTNRWFVSDDLLSQEQHTSSLLPNSGCFCIKVEVRLIDEDN